MAEQRTTEAYECYTITTNTCPSGAYRGVAQPTAFLAIEGMMDRIGRALGIDPAKVRLRNLVQPDELPYVNVVGVRYDTGSYVQSLRRALELARYDGGSVDARERLRTPDCSGGRGLDGLHAWATPPAAFASTSPRVRRTMC